MFEWAVRRSGLAGIGPPPACERARPLSLSWPKRVAFTVATLILAWGMLELGGFFLSWLALGEAVLRERFAAAASGSDRPI